MKIAFLYQAYESIAFEIFSKILKKNNHNVKLFFYNSLFQDYSLNNKLLANIFNKEIKINQKEIKNYNPDYIFFSVFTDNLKWTLDKAKKFKTLLPTSKIIFGGSHINITGKELIEKYDFIDFLVRGAGEEAVSKIGTQDFYKSSGLIYREENKIIENIWEILPDDKFINIFPDKKLFYNKIPFHKKYYITMSGYGCPHSCSFCIHSTYKKIGKENMIKRKNIDFLIKELKIAKKNGAEKIIFYDDIFTINEIWIINFLKKYIKHINLPFMCISHPNVINNKIAYFLKKARCVNIEIGTQILNDNIKTKYLNRTDSNKKVIETFKILNKYKIPFTVDHIIGLPEETIKDHLYSLKIYKKYKASRVILSSLTAYPEIALNKVLLKRKMISRNKLNQIRKGELSNFQFDGSVIINKEIKSLELLFEWLPFIPKKLFKSFLNKKLYTYIPKNKIISKYTPFLLKSIFSKNEYNLELFIKRYLFYLFIIFKSFFI